MKGSSMNPEDLVTQAPDLLRALADALEALMGTGAQEAQQAPADINAMAAAQNQQGQ